MSSIVPVRDNEENLAPLVDLMREYVESSQSKSTRRAYRSDWAAFEGWCVVQRVESLPARAEDLALYIATLAHEGLKTSSIDRALSAITYAHKAAGHDSPRDAMAVRTIMRGIKRNNGTAPRQVAPILVEDLRRMVKALPDTTKGVRDRAILLLGFAGAFRRSELAALDVEDLCFDEDGLTVTIRRSKTDQEGAGRKVGVPFGSDPATCPVRSLVAWVHKANILQGAIFRGLGRYGAVKDGRICGRDVARVIKAAARAAGLDPNRVSGHSLRAGLATAAAKAGKSERAIMAQTGHKSTVMVRKYIRNATLFEDNAAAGVGL